MNIKLGLSFGTRVLCSRAWEASCLSLTIRPTEDRIGEGGTHLIFGIARERQRRMDRAQIERSLGYLGQKLAEMQIQAAVLLLGGALMVTQIGNRKTTQDIDVTIATSDPHIYRAVQQAIALVTQEYKLPPTWINDEVTIITDQVGRPQAPKRWKTFGNLTVFIPELEYVMALKLFSARKQDDRDIKALAQRLGVETSDQAWACLNRYVHTALQARRMQDITKAIGRCFKDEQKQQGKKP